MQQIIPIFRYTLSAFMLFINELTLMSALYWYYRWNSLINILMTAADFIWWMLLLDGGITQSEKIAPLIVGYFIWIYANYIITDTNNLITETSQTGVLEQVYLSTASLAPQLMARFAAGALMCTAELFAVTAVLKLFFPVSIPWSLQAFPVFLITITGIGGFALIIAGIGLIFKKSQAFTYMIANILLFLNGAIVPVENLPTWIQWLSKTLPTSQGIIVLRELLFKNRSLANVITDGHLLLLIINTTIYLTLGLAILRYCERYAQRHGIVGHY
jgi:ABC-2 type transport system permease protein